MPALSTVDANHLNRELENVNANYWCSGRRRSCEKSKMQVAARKKVMHRQLKTVQVLHISLHSDGVNRKLMKGNQIIVLTAFSDEFILQSKEFSSGASE